MPETPERDFATPAYPPPYSQPPSYPYVPAGHPYTGQPVQYVIARPYNGLAIASMVLGIVWVYWIGSILAVIFGHVALANIKKTGQQGRGMAIAGLVLGYVGLALLGLVILVAATAESGGYY